MTSRPNTLEIRALLHREIEDIFLDATGSLPAREMIEDQIDSLVQAGRRGEVAQAAGSVIGLLSLDLDDLRKAALLSLIVRLTGHEKFDPVAAYVLEKRATYVTSQG